MPDSWDFALSHAQGAWIAVLEDDCVLSSRVVEEVNRVIEDVETELSEGDVHLVLMRAGGPPAEQKNSLAH